MKALLVEDSSINRQMLEYALTRRGHTITAVADAERAWDACQHEVFDLIVLDWILPGMDGLELCRRVRTLPHGDQSVVLVASMRDTPDALTAVLDAGANDYLAKADGFNALDVRLAVAEREVADIARRVGAEAALRESEELFRSAFSNAAIGIALVAPSGRWRRVNPSLCAMLGYAEGELVGARSQDFTHPDDAGSAIRQGTELLAGTLEMVRRELRFIHKDGQVIWVDLSVSVLRNASGDPTYFIAQFQDISARKEMEERLARLAFFDPLTDLPNRALFMERLKQAFAGRRRGAPDPVVMYLDLDGFKAVNDSHGHTTGDALLVTIGKRLQRCVREVDTCCRLGGDEFTILLDGVIAKPEAIVVAQRIIAAVSLPVPVPDGEVTVGISIGISFCKPEHTRIADLLREADEALYQAKAAGKGCYAVYRMQSDR